ncbi:MAG TPA: Stf0 family sulfotransferase [Stellaceae bacterium]|nr:Stf0 family sulfotransferase [Stellaceae bacterium]
MSQENRAEHPKNAGSSIDEDLAMALDSEFLDDEYLLRAFGLTRSQRDSFAECYGRLPAVDRPALSPFFDGAWYLDQYADVRESGRDPFLHFVRYGVFELRSPHPLISMRRVYDDNFELFYREGGCRSLLRVLRENRSDPSDHFDVKFYLDRYPEARRHPAGALCHFLERGVREWYWPNAYFDPKWYAQRHPQLAHDAPSMLRHFIDRASRPARASEPKAGHAMDAKPAAPADHEGGQIVVVLGMHRSGTSLCSHVLSTLGIDMGDIIEPTAANARGHWERPDLRELQDGVLDLFARGYRSAKHDLPLPSAWWEDSRVAPLREEIERVVRSLMAQGRPFGFKDPRTARLLPMWRQVFRSLGLVPKPVLCLRNPAQIARSVAARDGLDPALGEYRWFLYMMDILQSFLDDEICVIEYEDWFTAPQRNLAKLGRFLALPWAEAPTDIIDPRLRHDDPRPTEPRHPLLRSCYELARRCADDPAARQALSQMVREFASYQSLQSPLQQELDRRLAGSVAQIPRPRITSPQPPSAGCPSLAGAPSDRHNGEPHAQTELDPRRPEPQPPSKFALAFQRAAASGLCLTMPEAYRRRPGPSKVYCILFTPRSGSTWLAQEIARLDVMAHPGEYFQADELHNALAENPCENIVEYYDLVSKTKMTIDGIFGFQISYFDLEQLEIDLGLVHLMAKNRYFIYLNRRNFVQQGVSLHLAHETRRFHSLWEPDTPDGRERPVHYDGVKIKYWIAHILYQEYGIEQWLQARSLATLRISYEDMLPDIDGIIAKIARWIEVDVDFARPRLPIPSPARLYSKVNREFEARFRAENGVWCDEWTALRGQAFCESEWPGPGDLNDGPDSRSRGITHSV